LVTTLVQLLAVPHEGKRHMTYRRRKTDLSEIHEYRDRLRAIYCYSKKESTP